MILCDSVTTLKREARNAAVLSGSHGGAYPAFLAAEAGVRAIILNDAGLGRDNAGVAGLALLDAVGTAAATVSHRSARIGDAEDSQRRGMISHVNSCALRLGIEPGMWARDALELLHARAPPASARTEWRKEHRAELAAEDADLPTVVLLDSASQAIEQDRGRIVVTGSHGALLGGRLETALKVQAFAAVFNDAGVGIDRAGLSRLPALDERGIPAGTVGAWTARIGDGSSTFEDGIVSHVNRTARRCGAEVGMTARVFARIVQASAAGGHRP